MNKLLFLFFLCLVFMACQSTPSPSHVELVKTDQAYQLQVDGKSFAVKGVGMSAFESNYFQALQEAGGNAIRTWDTKNAQAVLDSAAKYNFMVALGLHLDKELHGFDYQDKEAVSIQFERIKKEVLAFKDHPNLLCWVAGNELNLLFDEQGQLKLVSAETYQSLAEIVDFIHEVDPHHPVTTTLAGYHPDHIPWVYEHCPQIDFLSFQVYGALYAIREDLAKMDFDKPYFITEYGPIGHWEMPATAWGREIEESSSPKAAGFRARLERGFAPDPAGQNLGGFAFLWGQKQERTPTWYGMFLASGEKTETIDELTHYWTGAYPAHRAPKVDSIRLNGQREVDNVYLQPGQSTLVEVFGPDAEKDNLTYRWEVLKEVVERSQGGAFEQQPDAVEVEGLAEQNGSLRFRAPAEEGDYRVFVYVYDGKGKAGYANFPFYVQP